MELKRFIALSLTILITVTHNPHRINPQLTPTLVTAWWPLPNSSNSSNLPTGTFLKHFEKLLALPINLIVFGDSNLAEFIASKRQSKNTKFF